MLIILSLFAFYVVGSSYYIHLLNERIRSYEENWSQIEKFSDHNKEGDVVIHIRKTEDQ